MNKINHYQSYKNARDAAWKLLIDQNVCNLPVKIGQICKNLSIPVLSYEQGRAIIVREGLSDNCMNNDGFTFAGAIFFNQTCSIPRRRFTVAHELGHLIMLHKGDLINREPSTADNSVETAANVMASRLLAPACVLWGIGVRNADDIRRLCDISRQSAEFRMIRMHELYAREEMYLKLYGHSCFLQSPLERAVYHQFQDFIHTHKL